MIYILAILSLFLRFGVGVAVAAFLGYIWLCITDDSIGEPVLLLAGMIIGFPGGLSLDGTICDKIKRAIFGIEL